jgi:hypothetical protein
MAGANGDIWTIFHIGPDKYMIFLSPGKGVIINFKGADENKVLGILNKAMINLPLSKMERDLIRSLICKDRRFFSKEYQE